MLNVRADFPYLERRVNGRPLIYLDSAATTQKPRQVIQCLLHRYACGITNVHRAVSFLADEVTEEYERARDNVARFLRSDSNEIIFVGNATQAINLVCGSLTAAGPLHVVTTTLEHHSNFVPWLTRTIVDLVPWKLSSGIDLDELDRALASAPRPVLLTVARASNFTGTLHDIKEAVKLGRRHGALTLVDACQSIAHEPVDVRQLDCDFLVFSGHKIYGPSGVGVLFVRSDVTRELSPQILGGHMVKEVHANRVVFNDIPHLFEAGTPNIEGVIALGAALDYVTALGFDRIAAHERMLLDHARRRLTEMRTIRLFGPRSGEASAPLVSFEMRGLDSATVAKGLAGRANIVVRSGFHCAQPAHDQLGAGPTIRASFGVYNTIEEIDELCETLDRLSDLLVS